MAVRNTDTSDASGRAAVALRSIPVSRIAVADGFNPRGEVAEDEALRALAATMRERGCLQPVRVREGGDGGYVLIAGERRYRAALLAGLQQIPAVILAPREGDAAEQLDLLVDAVVENELRAGLDPLQRAKAYRAMMDGGLSVRGVAERLGGGAGRAGRERRIREHLTILELPREIGERVGAGEVPLSAVRALAGLASVHAELAAAAVQAVLAPGEGQEPYTWSEVAEEPLAVAVEFLQELPAGLFNTARSHPIECFSLSETARGQLAEYERLAGRPLASVRFAPVQLEQARALGGLQECGWFALVAGQDVADQLAEECVAAALEQERALRAAAEAASPGAPQDPAGDDAAAGPGGPSDGASAKEREQSLAEQAAAERERRRAEAQEARSFNEQLGQLAYRHLARMKPDERVLRVLASTPLAGSLRGVAARGARLCMPGWTESAADGSGPVRYVEGPEAAVRAADFLEGARSPAEIAGRSVALLALAALADERALPPSRRSWYTLAFSGPWAAQAESDLCALVRERIKEGQLPRLDELLSERLAAAEASEEEGA